MSYDSTGTVRCDDMGACGADGAPRSSNVAYIDEKGYVYCGDCGPRRQGGGICCRRMTGPEIRHVKAGHPLPRYSPPNTAAELAARVAEGATL